MLALAGRGRGGVPSDLRATASFLLGVLWLGVGAACSTRTVPVPARDRPDASVSGDGDAGAEPPPPPEVSLPGRALGRTCVDSEQCDDGHDCTFDTCDAELERCIHDPNHAECADDLYCNGVEVCDPKAGCRAGPPVSCSDGIPCTIDGCDEATDRCEHERRDADGDGTPDRLCLPTGGDCNDRDANVSPNAPEICDNQRDDDCDDTPDESDCERPAWDTCEEPLVIEGSGSFALEVAAARLDHPAECLPDVENLRDVVVALDFMEGLGTAAEVTVATVSGATLSVLATAECAVSDEGTCLGGSPSGEISLSRTLVGGAPGTRQWLRIYTDSLESVELRVEFSDREAEPVNWTCEAALPIELGETYRAFTPLGGAGTVSECSATSGQLFYRFELESLSDVEVFATASGEIGVPALSLGTSCSEEVLCMTRADARLFARALEPGEYWLTVSAEGPADVGFVVEASPPTEAPAGDSCSNSVDLEIGTEQSVRFEGLSNDVAVGCLPGGVDAALELTLEERSDVLMVERLTDGDQAALSLSTSDCAGLVRERCVTSSRSPLRWVAHDLPAGEYTAVVESLLGNPTTLTTFTRPARAPVLVPLSRSCETATPIPAQGGLFQGNTANSEAKQKLSCDLGGLDNAPEQFLKFQLTEQTRVVLDTQGSNFSTALVLREAQAEECLGDEVPRACAVGLEGQRSYLDVTLEPGAYLVQVDGYAGASGQWFLDVFLGSPL